MAAIHVSPKTTPGMPSRPLAAAFGVVVAAGWALDVLPFWRSFARIQITSDKDDEEFPRLVFPAGRIVVTKGIILSIASSYSLSLNLDGPELAVWLPMSNNGWTVLFVPSSQGRLPKEGSGKTGMVSEKLP